MSGSIAARAKGGLGTRPAIALSEPGAAVCHNAVAAARSTIPLVMLVELRGDGRLTPRAAGARRVPRYRITAYRVICPEARRRSAMLTLPSGLLGRDIDLGRVEVTTEEVRRYAVAIGDERLAAGPCHIAPLGFALAVRGNPRPHVDLAVDTVSVHGGHTITLHAPLTAPAPYHVRARLTDVFEKNGRSGPLTVLARSAEIRTGDGRLVASIDDQQIVRWKRAAAPPAPPRSAAPPPAPGHAPTAASDASELEVGSPIGPLRRLAPSSSAIAAYADRLGGGERLFVDRAAARSLGYRDVIVPGPLQAAIFETMLRNALRGWALRRISMTFRVSVPALEPIVLRAIVVEHHLRPDGALAVCDLAIENSDGEGAALGIAELVRA